MDVAEDSAAHKYAIKYSYAYNTREPQPFAKYSGTCGEGLTWELYTDGILYINGSGEMPDYTYAKYGENAAPWSLYRSEITKVVIGAGVKNIGTYAFYQCTEVTEIEFADEAELVAINEGAFGYTTALKNITLPASLDSIGKCGFYFSGLETVEFEENSKLTTLGDYVFRNCEQLVNVYIPSNVNGIGYSIYYACSSVNSSVEADSYAVNYMSKYGYEYTIR